MRRIAELDGLRAVAAVMIVAYHLWMDYLPGFWAAVDVFFVLSGFLITSILLRHEFSWRFLVSFYARRGLRIWPIYYLVILLLVVCRLYEPSAVPYYLSYTQQIPHYWGAEMPSWPEMQHTWTLALEEQFYLIWPFLLLLVGRRLTVFLAAGLAVAAILARVAGTNVWVLAGRCDGFALGGLLAAIVSSPNAETARLRAKAWGIGFGAMTVALVTLMAATGRLLDVGGPLTTGVRVTVASLGSFALVAMVVCHAGHPVLALLRSRPLVYLGTISYGIYLYHHVIIQMGGPIGEFLGLPPGPGVVAIECLLTLVVAVASWHLVERPILRLKDHLPYERDADSPQRSHVPRSHLPARDAFAPAAR